MGKCLFCNRGLEAKHYICDVCGNGMCELCYQEDRDHSEYIVYNPSEVCEGINAILVSIKFPGYGCYDCIEKIKEGVNNGKVY